MDIRSDGTQHAAAQEQLLEEVGGARAGGRGLVGEANAVDRGGRVRA